MIEVEYVEVTWRHATKVWWSLIWRALLFGSFAIAAVGLVLGFLMELVNINPETIKAICIVTGYIVCVPIGIVVTKLVLNKSYSNFRIALIAK